MFLLHSSSKTLRFTSSSRLGMICDLCIGYFVFLDLGGFVNFVPGTVMTLISGSAVILSAIVYVAGPKGRARPPQTDEA